jgi:hypothetical protein
MARHAVHGDAPDLASNRNVYASVNSFSTRIKQLNLQHFSTLAIDSNPTATPTITKQPPAL